MTQYSQFSLLLCLTHTALQCNKLHVTGSSQKLKFDAFVQLQYTFIQNNTAVFNELASSVSFLITITAYVATLATLIATFG